MSPYSKPIVYISYSWIDQVRPDGSRKRVADPRGRELADRLRAKNLDVRLDMYFFDGVHGFRPPQVMPNDSRDPWLVWSQQQIAEADAVVMLCAPGYADSDPNRGANFGEWSEWTKMDESKRRVQESLSPRERPPALWWDWLAISREIQTRREKFIPVEYGPYDSSLVPAFVRGATCYDLTVESMFEALVRQIRDVYRRHHPREGVFISYAHDDDQKWLDTLLTHFKPLKQLHKFRIWTDRDILPGEEWHEAIEAELDRAKVAVLLVSPEFLDSEYIRNEELPRMLEAAKSDGLTIFWIPVRPSAWETSPIRKFQSAHTPPSKPLSSLTGAKRDQAFVDIGKKLVQALGV